MLIAIGERLVTLLVYICEKSCLAASLIQRFMRGFQPWVVFFIILGVLITVSGFIVEMEDRQAARIFRAWQLVLQSENIARVRERDGRVEPQEVLHARSIVPALEFLNRSFRGKVCGPSLKIVFRDWMGSIRRECVIPRKYATEFSGLFLPRNNLQEAQLPYSSFVSVNLERSNLLRAILTGAKFSRGNLQQVILRGAKLDAATFVGTDLRQSQLDDAAMEQVSFIDADLQNASLRYANVAKADFSRAKLNDADLFMANLTGSNLSEAIGLTREQVEKACVSVGKQGPILPVGIKNIDWKVKPCGVGLLWGRAFVD